MAVRIFEHDWSTTALGPRDRWPQSLRVALDICLGSRFPMFIWWGPSLINLYNDAYIPILRQRHPQALGRSAKEVWRDVWPMISAQVEAVFERGEASWNQRMPLTLERNGGMEEAYFTWSHSPILDEGGKVGGILCVVTEDTQIVHAERERDRLAERWRRADEQSRIILESITDAFFALDREWRFTYLNAQAERVLNRPNGELLGKVIWDEYPGLKGSDFERLYRRAATEREPGVLTAFYPDHDRWYEVHVYPAVDGGISIYFRNVTERKRDEQALRQWTEKFEQQSRLFEQIASTTPDFIYVFDPQGRFLYANRRLLEVWGRTAEEAVGKNLYELGYPQWHADMHMREIRQVIETRRPVKGEVPFTGGSGIFGVYEYIFTPVLSATGEVEAIAGTTRDVTERKNSEKELAEAKAAAETSLALWRGVVANMAEGVILADAQGNMLEWNEAALSMHGFESMDEVRKGWTDIASFFELQEEGRVLPLERWPVNRLLRGEKFTGWELQVRRRDVDLDLLISYSGVPIRDRDGNISVVLLTLHDMTEERRTQAALRQSEQRLRAVVEATPECVKIVSPEGALLYMNPAGICMIEAEAMPAVQGACVYDIIAPKDRAEWIERHRRVCAGEKLTWEFQIIGLNGTHRWMETHAVPLPMPDGRNGQLAVTRDITARKRVEAEREQLLESERAARVEAQRASRMKDEFLSTLSHELRTPLNAIVGWSQILRRPSADPADLAEGIATIERNARAQAQIIDDLLDMSRITSGKLRLDVQRVDLAGVVNAGIDTVRPTAEAKGVRLSAIIDPAAGPVSGDPSRLHQVLWNLLTNAVKFTPKGGRVQVVLERVNSHVEISVIDTGEGIRPEFLPHVFDRFRQADASTTRRHGGLGLGLAIVKQLVEMHGGSVRVDSRGPGCGSTFTVALPLTVLHPAAEPEADRRHPRGAPPLELGSHACVQLQGVKVLVIDDEPDARALVRRVLEDCDAEVRLADSAEEAIRELDSYRPDVLISDIGMPREDGYSLIRKIRARGPEAGGAVPAVALTAYARSEDRIRAMRSGFQMHVVKPVDPAELITVVASLAGRMTAT
jgi:PAS domain S-box-containing protein